MPKQRCNGHRRMWVPIIKVPSRPRDSRKEQAVLKAGFPTSQAHSQELYSQAFCKALSRVEEVPDRAAVSRRVRSVVRAHVAAAGEASHLAHSVVQVDVAEAADAFSRYSTQVPNVRERKAVMPAQQSILGRIAQLARANVNNLLDAAEDPQIMIDQMIRDYTDNIQDAEGAIAQTLGNLRLMEEDIREDEKAVLEWGQKAKAASAKADQMRAAGQAAEADKFDNLARLALKKQIDFEQEAAALKPTVESQTVVVDKLRSGLDGMKERLGELKSKRDELVSRERVAEAQTQVQDAIQAIDITDPTSELGRFEDKIRREEAKARGAAELAASTLDSQFESLEVAEDDIEIEARLAGLKSSQ